MLGIHFIVTPLYEAIAYLLSLHHIIPVAIAHSTHACIQTQAKAPKPGFNQLTVIVLLSRHWLLDHVED